MQGDFARDATKLFERYDATDSPGAVVRVIHDGDEVFTGAWGMANINQRVPLDTRSIIRIGSQTKQFAVLLILMLEAEGKLRLDDTVQTHLPFVPNFEHRVTLAHLAANSSGMRDYIDGMIHAGRSIQTPTSRQAVSNMIATHDGLNFQPGSAMLYSNSGFFLLSEIIEKIESEPFDAVLQRRITGPLGMTDTRLMGSDGEVQARMASHYTREGDRWMIRHWGLVLGGEGGMVSTLEDMTRWQANLKDPEVGTAEMIARMSTANTYANGAVGPYGLGLVADTYRGRMAVGHGGTVAGGKSESMSFVDDGLSIVIIANNDQCQTFSLARRLADIWFGETGPRPQFGAEPGLYREAGGSGIFAVATGLDGPQFISAGGKAVFDHLGDDTFKPERGITDMRLTARQDGAIDALWCGTPTVYRRLSNPSEVQSDTALNGCYENPSMGMTAQIQGDRRNAVLSMRSDIGARRVHLVAIDRDLWMILPEDSTEYDAGTPWSGVLKTTDAGFELCAERIRKVAFTRT